MKRMILMTALMLVLCACQHGGNIQSESDNNIDAHGADIDGLNDPLEDRVVVKVGNTGGVFSGGKFFRGYVDKTAKTAIYQFYAQYNSPQWMNWDRSKYQSREGLKELSTSRVGHEARCNAYKCGYFEDVLIQLDRADVEQWKSTKTTVRISSSTVSGSQDVEVSDEDAKDFLNAMDALVSYLNRKAAAKSPPDLPAKPAAK